MKMKGILVGKGPSLMLALLLRILTHLFPLRMSMSGEPHIVRIRGKLEFGDGVGGKWKTSEEVLAGIPKGI